MTRKPLSVYAAALSLTAACVTGGIAGPLPSGVWGGPQGNLTVYADSASLDLPCAAGRIPSAIPTGGDGTFDLSGFYAPEAGPVSVNGPLWQPASFKGSRSGDDLTMTITLSSGTAIGPLQFHRGTVGQFPRCL
jgi:hypothetical protein